MNLSPSVALPAAALPVAWPEAAAAIPRLLRPQPRRMWPGPATAHVPSVTDAATWALDRAYMQRGGLARGDELLTLVRVRCDQPISRVARWIVGREIVQYRSGLDAAFPLFQFELGELSVRPAVSQVLAELGSVMDDLELAQWFVRGNSELQGAQPAELIDSEPDAVVGAARADRFVMKG